MKKRNRTLITLGIVWLVLALTFLILGFALSGVDLIAWFGSKWAMMVYIFLTVYLMFILFFIIFPAIIRRL